MDDFGYAGARKLIRIRANRARSELHLLDQGTMP
jgi:hypothetical protein